MTIRSLARRGAALALSAALALTAPAWAAPQDDWQTLYKGELRRLLTQGAAGPQSLFAVLADLNLDGAPELFTLSSDGLTQRQYTAGEGRLSPLAMEEGEDWGGRQLQNLRLYFNSQTGQYKLTAEYSHSAENGFSASGGISCMNTAWKAKPSAASCNFNIWRRRRAPPTIASAKTANWFPFPALNTEKKWTITTKASR